MADNTELASASGGDIIATDDIAGVKYPRSKITIGADGTNDGDVSATNPLPIKGTGTAGTANSGVVTIQGIASMTAVVVDGSTVTQPVSAASLPLPSGAATAANQATIITHVDGLEGLLTTIDADTSTLAAIDYATGADVASLAVVGGGLEATALRVTIASDSTGVVSVDDGGGAITVDNGGTFAVQSAQSGTWTVQPGNTANTTAWLVTGTGGTFPVTDSGGSLTVDNAGTFAVQVDGAALTSLQLIDDVIGTSHDPYPSKMAVVGGRYDTATVVLEDGDCGALKLDASRNLCVGAPVGSPVFVRLSDGASAITTLPVSLASVPSHAVTNAGTFAVQSTLQAGTAYAGKVRLTDGTTDAEVVALTGYNAQAVAIVDGDGNQITSFGGGTQYTEGDTDATITGTAMLMEGAANTLVAAQGTAADGLLVNLGSNNDVTVTGTVTANAGSGTFAVSAASLPLPSGAATSANQSTEIGHLATLAGAVSGTEFQVDVLTMPTVAVTGTFWQATQPVSGTVTATISAGATTIAKAEDAAHTTGDTGVFALSVRSDTAASTAGTDGDYAALITDSTGRLHCNVSNTVAVSNAGTFATQAAQSGTWNVTNISGTVSLPTGAATAANQSTIIGHVDGIEGLLTTIDADTGTLAVVGNGAAATAQRVTLANDSTGIVALTTSTASIGKLASNTGVTIGAVEIAAAQTLATVTTVSTVTTCSTVTTLTGGGVAHDSADSGNPIKVGARAAATLSDDTMVANADRTDMVSDLDGALITRPNFPAGDILSDATSNTDGSSTASGVFTATASTRSCITAFQVFRTDAGTTPIYIDFRDGTGGSVIWRAVLPAGGGANSPAYCGPCLFRTSANTALAYDVSAATSTVYINVSGYKSKV